MARDTLVAAGAYDDCENAFQNIFRFFKNVFQDHQYENLDTKRAVLLFRGGEDIHPSIYGEKRIPQNGSPGLLSERDAFELKLFRFGVQHGIPMLGICRGSQFLCAASGGKLVQHVNSHGIGGTHPILTVEGKQYGATSTHHQMMYPWPTEHKLLAWSAPRRSDVYILSPTDRRDELIAEPEVVFFNKTKALGIQGHPEYLTQEHPYTQYCNTLVKEYLL